MVSPSRQSEAQVLAQTWHTGPWGPWRAVSLSPAQPSGVLPLDPAFAPCYMGVLQSRPAVQKDHRTRMSLFCSKMIYFTQTSKCLF